MALNDLAKRLRQFAEERDWNQFHSPKNLAISISVEAAELLELFQWSRGRDDWDCMQEEAIHDRTAEELADILLYLVRFADNASCASESAGCNVFTHSSYLSSPMALRLAAHRLR